MNLSVGAYVFCITVSLKIFTSILRVDDFEASISLSYRMIKLFHGIFKHWSTSTVGMNTGWYWVNVSIGVTPLASTGGCGWKSRIIPYYFYFTIWIVFLSFERVCTCCDYSYTTSVRMKMWLVPEVQVSNHMCAKKGLNKYSKFSVTYLNWLRAIFWSQKLHLNNVINQCD